MLLFFILTAQILSQLNFVDWIGLDFVKEETNYRVLKMASRVQSGKTSAINKNISAHS